MTCANCEAAKVRARAAGHRDSREGACFDCAGVSLDECFARIGFVPDEKLVARELAKMNAQRREPAEPDPPVQLSLFG